MKHYKINIQIKVFRKRTSIIVIGRYLENPLNILKISDPVLNINGNSNEEM